METKKLGFGLMRLPLLDKNDAASIDIEHTCKMVDAFLEKGFTYFDTAWFYCGFESENIAKKVLVDRYPRESFTLATKLHYNYIKTLDDRDRIIEEQLKKTGAGYFDYYLLHDLGGHSYSKFENFDCFSWIREKKEQGLVKHIGFSFHGSADDLDMILSKHPEFEFVQMQLNYLDWEDEKVQSRRCYETARKYNLPIIVMEPVKGGTLARLPESALELCRHCREKASPASLALRFVAELEGIWMILSGMSNLEQMMDNLEVMDDPKPLTPEERTTIEGITRILKEKIAIPCTGCSYCTDGCPQNIAIPQFFSLYNNEKQGTESKADYDKLLSEFGSAGSCLMCHQCEAACPQHLPIVKYLTEVAKTFE